MRRQTVALAVLAVTVVAAGCSREEKPTANKPFCRAADRYNEELERTQLEGSPSIERQIPIIADLAATAPQAIAADVQTFLDALERRADGDTSVVDNPRISKAVDNVNRYANKACNVYERDTGL
jgi:hypothetical protein